MLRLFVAVVDAGSLSAAARAAGTTLPTVSRRLRQLEARLGVRLLQRTTRRQALTEEGRLLYRRALRVLGDLDEVEREFSRHRAIVSGTLRVAAPWELGHRHIAPLLAAFGAQHPELYVQLALTDAEQDLVASEMDLAIRFGGLDDSSCVSRPLAPSYRVVCASPDYLRCYGVPQHPSELEHHRCLQIGPPALSDWRFDGDPPLTVRIDPRLSSNDGETVHRWALAGYGIARKSIWDVREDLAAGRLVQVLQAYPSPAAPLHAVYPHHRHQLPRVRAFLDCLVAYFGAAR